MTNLKIIKREQMEKLRKAVSRNLDLYRSDSPNWENVLETADYTRLTQVEVADNYSECLGDYFSTTLSEGAKGAERVRFMKKEPARCEAIYKILKNMTPQQATDERVWVYLTHFVFWDYSRARWPLGKDNDEQSAKIVATHFFASGIRGRVRDNAISRLWWMGHICAGLDHDLRDALEALLLQEDVRKEVMERAAFCRSKQIFNVLTKFMIRSCKGNQKLHGRQKFREFIRRLNRLGGMRVLNAMPEKQLEEEMKRIIEEDLKLDPEFPSSR